MAQGFARGGKHKTAMKVISTRVHGVLDYLVGALLIAAPWIFDFADNGPAMWVPIIIGAMSIVMALITDFELSVAKIIPMRVHLMMDVLAGLLLAASPWLFGFADYVYLPHLVVGLTKVVVVILSERVPRTDTANRTSDTRMAH